MRSTTKVKLSPKATAIVIVAFGALLSLFGFAAKSIVLTRAQRATESLSWDEVEATVVVSKVTWDVWERKNHPIPGNKLVYGYQINYSYRYNGKELTGNMWSFVENSGVIPKEEANMRATAHPVGSKINIRVNPSRPDESVVIPGGELPQSTKQLLFIPYALAGVGALIALLGIVHLIRNFHTTP